MDLATWKEAAQASQLNFGNLLGDRVWDRFVMPGDRNLLEHKIGFAVFGPPRDANVVVAYSKAEKKIISELLEKCVKYSGKSPENEGDVYIAFIFVCVFSEGSETTTPVIRVKWKDGKNVQASYYIDRWGRVYKQRREPKAEDEDPTSVRRRWLEEHWSVKETSSWDVFLANNDFEKSWICVPSGGEYTFEDEIVKLDFRDQTGRGKVVRVVDTLATVSGITTGLTMAAGVVMSLFPPTAPIGAPIVVGSAVVGAPGAVYGVGRSVGRLFDRGRHDQSISLLNSESRGCWINVAASLLSLGTLGTAELLSEVVKTGSIATYEIGALCMALNVSCVSVSGMGILNFVYELVQKREVSALDLLQLSQSIFFFTHALVNFQTANDIVRRAQGEKMAEGHLNGFGLRSKEDAQSGALSPSNDDIHSKAPVGNHPEEFRTDVVSSNKVEGVRSGIVSSNKVPEISTGGLTSNVVKEMHTDAVGPAVHEDNHNKVVNAFKDEPTVPIIKRLKIKGMHGGAATFIKEIKRINTIEEFYAVFRLVTGGQLKKAQVHAPAHAKSFVRITESQRGEILRLSTALSNQKITEEEFASNPNIAVLHDVWLITFEHNVRESRSRVSRALAKIVGLDGDEEMIAGQRLFGTLTYKEVDRLDQILSFVGQRLESKWMGVLLGMADKVGCRCVSALTDLMLFVLRNLHLNLAKVEDVHAAELQLKQVYDEFLKSALVQEQLMAAFRSCVSVQSNVIVRPIVNESLISFPKNDANNNLTSEQYFEIANELAGKLVSFPKWTQHGASLCCNCVSSDYGVITVRFDNLADAVSVIATIFGKDLPEDALGVLRNGEIRYYSSDRNF